MDTEDLHVAVGTILGERDKVLLSDGLGRELRKRDKVLVGIGGDSLTISGDEKSVLNVGLLGGLIGDEGKSEDSTAESGSEDSGSNEHLLGTIEASSESLDRQLKSGESRATSCNKKYRK